MMTIKDFISLPHGTKLLCIKAAHDLELNRVYTFNKTKDNLDRILLTETWDFGWKPERFIVYSPILNTRLKSGGNI